MAVRKTTRQTNSRAMSSRKKRTSVKQRRERRLLGKVVFVLIVVGSIFVSVLYVLNQQQFRISTVEIQGGVITGPELIKEQTHLLLEGSSWLVFPNDSWLWYDKAELVTRLLTTYPTIDTVQVSVQGFETLQVVVTEKVTAYHLWNDGIMYELDQSGVLFAEVPQDTPTERLFYSHIQEGSLQLRDSVIDADSFVQFNEFLDDLANLGVVVKKIMFVNSIETILELENTARIVIRPDTKHSALVTTLREVLRYKEFGYDYKAGVFSKPVEYINLRYGNKLFYCYTDDECQSNYKIK